MFLTNKIATYNNAAPSISLGRLVAKGEKNKHAKNKTPITNEVIPVLPPAFTPAALSTSRSEVGVCELNWEIVSFHVLRAYARPVCVMRSG